jgi:hypothetical protein
LFVYSLLLQLHHRITYLLDIFPAGNPDHLVVLLATFKFSRYMVFPSSGAVDVILHQVGRMEHMIDEQGADEGSNSVLS